MVLTWWLRRMKQQLASARPAARGPKRRPTYRPTVEMMEDRVVPASRLFAIPLAPSPGTGQIVELSPTTGAVLNTLTAPQPATTTGEVGLAFDGSRLFYLNGGADDRLYELNPNTGAVIDSDPVVGGSGGYDGLAVVAGQVYIQDYNTNQVLVFDPVTDTVVRTLNVAADLLGGLAGASAPGALIGTINNGTAVAEVNPTTGAVTNTFSTGSSNLPGAAVVGNDIYLGSGNSNTILRFSRTGSPLGQLTIPFRVGALASDDPATAAPTTGSQFVNGNFEAGNVSGWTVFNVPGSGSPGFTAYTGANPPQSGLPAPPQGSFAAYNGHTAPGSYILYQDVTVPAAQLTTLTLTAYYQNQFTQGVVTPATLDYRTGPNQQFRIDIVSPTGDLLSTASDVVKLNVFRTVQGDPLARAPFTLTADLSPFAGQTVRLRIAVANNQLFFYGGVDNVSLTSGSQAPTGTVSGVKFNDLNGNGTRDPNEPGLQGWTVYADLNNNRQLDPNEPSAVTAANGSYTLVVAPGTNTFREVPQAGWVQTAPNSDRLFSARVGTTGGPQVITEYDATGAPLNSFAGPAAVQFQGPQGLAFSGDGLFYINGEQSTGGTGPHTLYELDPATGAVFDSDVLPATSEIAGLGHLNGLVYIQVHQPNQILVFDPVSDTVVRTLTVPADIQGGMTGASDLGLLFASNTFGQIFAINPQTGAIVRTLSPGVGSLVGGLAYFRGELVATNAGPTTFRINPQTGAVLGTINLNGPGGSIAGLAGDGKVAGGRRLSVAANQSITLDFGDQRNEGTVSGVKFNDLNGNGTRDPNEPGLQGWTVYADTNNNRQFDPGEPSAVTAADGSYTLSTPSGAQTIREVAQGGWVQTAPLSATLYANANDGNLLTTINPTTGAAAVVGPFGSPQSYPVAFSPSDGTLWTIVNSSNPSAARLAQVDPNTGQATPIGNPNWTGSPIIALGADATGTLYGASFGGQLFRFNKTTGAATLIGSLGFQGVEDLAFDRSGGLWALDNGGRLFRVDPATGTGAFITNVTGTIGQPIGLAIHPATGVFYITTSSSFLYTLNPTTGAATLVNSFLGLPASPGADFATETGYAVTVTPGSTLTSRDFGNQRDEGTVSGVKYEDLDGDGTRDPGEPSLSGWTIYADRNNNGQFDPGEPSVVTGTDGSYSLTLASGSYAVREVAQPGWVQTSATSDRMFALRSTSPQTLSVVELDQFGFVVNAFPAPAPVASAGPQGLAVGRNSLFYIDGSQAVGGIQTLYELDPFTGAVLDSDPVQVNGPASGLGYLDGLVYIIGGNNLITVFNPATDTVVRTLNVGGFSLLGGLTGAADLGLLFAATSANLVLAIDPVTGAVVRTLGVPSAPLLGGYAYRSGELLGVTFSPNSPAPILRIDPVTGAIRGALAPVGPGTSGLGGDGPLPGPQRVTITPGAVLTGRDFGNQQAAPPSATDDTATVSEDVVLTVPARGVLANDTGMFGARAVVAVNGSPTAVGQTIPLPSGSLLRVNSDGSYTYIPSGFGRLRAGETATDSFTYTMADGAAATASATVTVTILGANDAPVAQPDTFSTNEDTVAAGNVLANDLDFDAGDTRAVVEVNGSAVAVGQTVTLTSGARLTVQANGTFVYDPSGAWDALAVGQSATDGFGYTMADGDGATSQTSVVINLTGVNDAPVAVADTGETDEDTPLSGIAPGVLDNDTDPDASDTRAVFAVNGSSAAVGQPITLASGARLTLRADGSYDYDPSGAFDFLRAGEATTDVASYTIADATGATSTATLTITVHGLNDAPVAAPDAGSTDEDSALVVGAPGLLGNDADPDHDTALGVVEIDGAASAVGQAVALASGAVLTVFADGSYTYNPNGAFEALGTGQTATDSFTYRVSDGTAEAVAVVTVTITGVNDAPVAQGVPLAANEDGPAVAGSFAATDAEPGALTFSVLTGPAEGHVVNNGDGTFTFDPGTDFQDLLAGAQRTVTFTYQATDADGGISDPATVIVTVTGANDAPVAGNDAGTTNEDTVLYVAAPGLLGNDTDVDTGDTRTVAAVNGTATAVGQPVVLASGAVVTVFADGHYIYNPNGAFEALAPGQTATDSFTYTATDSAGATSTATVTATVTGVNDAPVANSDSYVTDEDTDLVVLAAGVLVNDTDVDGGPLTAAVLNGPAHGTVTVSANGAFTYHPNANFNGSDGFTYTASDGHGGTVTGTVSITVRAVNDGPALAAATFSLPENSPNGTVVGTVAGADVDDTNLRYRMVSGNTGGAFTIDPVTGRVTVANAGVLDFETTPTFALRVEVRDPAGLTATATVTVRLTDVVTPRIDIVPNDSRNRINRRSNGRVSVAILSSSEFNALLVNPFTLRFGRTGQEDSLSQIGGLIPRIQYTDVNHDGRLDMVVEFEIGETGFRLGDTKGVLTGKLFDGFAFSVEDSVTIR